MKTLVLATALAVTVAAPALARPGDHIHRIRRDHVQVSTMLPASQGVYVNGMEVARDPDPAIRVELSNEYYDSRGG